MSNEERERGGERGMGKEKGKKKEGERGGEGRMGEFEGKEG